MNFDLSGLGKGLELEGYDNIDEVSKEICEKGAEILARHTKSALSGHSRTGALIGSVGAGRPKYIDKYGGYHAAVQFRGSDSKGARNGMKAFQLEYGNRRQPATPFVDRAISSAEGEIRAMAERTIAGRYGK